MASTSPVQLLSFFVLLHFQPHCRAPWQKILQSRHRAFAATQNGARTRVQEHPVRRARPTPANADTGNTRCFPPAAILGTRPGNADQASHSDSLSPSSRLCIRTYTNLNGDAIPGIVAASYNMGDSLIRSSRGCSRDAVLPMLPLATVVFAQETWHRNFTVVLECA